MNKKLKKNEKKKKKVLKSIEKLNNKISARQKKTIKDWTKDSKYWKENCWEESQQK